MINIFQATTEHLNDLALLFDQYRQFYGKSSEPEKCKKFLEQRIENNQIISFLAIKDESPAGLVNIYPTFSSVSMVPVWIFNDLYVSKDHRKQGVAKQLMNHTYAEAKKAGIGSLQLETASDNKPAQTLYEKDGWQKNEFLSYFYSMEGQKSG